MTRQKSVLGYQRTPVSNVAWPIVVRVQRPLANPCADWNAIPATSEVPAKPMEGAIATTTAGRTIPLGPSVWLANDQEGEDPPRLLAAEQHPARLLALRDERLADRGEGGVTIEAAGMSSLPITERSAGTRSPASVAAWRTPRAS